MQPASFDTAIRPDRPTLKLRELGDPQIIELDMRYVVEPFTTRDILATTRWHGSSTAVGRVLRDAGYEPYRTTEGRFWRYNPGVRRTRDGNSPRTPDSTSVERPLADRPDEYSRSRQRPRVSDRRHGLRYAPSDRPAYWIAPALLTAAIAGLSIRPTLRLLRDSLTRKATRSTPVTTDVEATLHRLAQRVDPLPLRPRRPERIAIIAALALAAWALIGLTAARIAGRL